MRELHDTLESVQELDDETIAAIIEGEEQGDRGEGIELAAFRECWEKRPSE